MSSDLPHRDEYLAHFSGWLVQHPGGNDIVDLARVAVEDM
jgi:hypothetical protein